MKLAIASFAALVAVAFFFTPSSRAVRAHGTKAQPEYFGACYTLFNCEGASIGYFDDAQCRQYGGHSIKVGAMCMSI